MTNFHSIHPTQLTNLTLNLKHLNKLTHFYSNLLPFSIQKQTNQQTLFNIPNLPYTLTLNQLNNRPQPQFTQAGLFHV
ncbi:VOC family protein, partial [Staphylococcus epidermidis]